MDDLEALATALQLTAGSADQCVLAFWRCVQQHDQLVLQQWQAHGVGPSDSKHYVQCPLQAPKWLPSQAVTKILLQDDAGPADQCVLVSGHHVQRHGWLAL